MKNFILITVGLLAAAVNTSHAELAKPNCGVPPGYKIVLEETVTCPNPTDKTTAGEMTKEHAQILCNGKLQKTVRAPTTAISFPEVIQGVGEAKVCYWGEK